MIEYKYPTDAIHKSHCVSRYAQRQVAHLGQASVESFLNVDLGVQLVPNLQEHKSATNLQEIKYLMRKLQCSVMSLKTLCTRLN